MTHNDTHPVAKREGNQAQAQGSQAPSSMSVDRAGYERRGEYKDAGYGTPSTQAQGKSGKGNGYNSGADIHKPSPTEVKEHQSHVQKPPPTEVTGNQSQVSSPGSVMGYDQTRVSSAGYGTGHDQPGGYKDHVQKPPTAEGGVHKPPLNQPPVAAHDRTNAALPLGPRNGHYQVSGHEDPSKTPAVPFQVNVNVQFGQDGTFRVNPAPAPVQTPAPRPAPAPGPPPAQTPNLPPPKSSGCCSIL